MGPIPNHKKQKTMKKNISLALFFLCVIIFFQSCNNTMRNNVEATIFRESVKPSGLLVPGEAWYNEHQVFDGVTKSGDTLQIVVSKKMALEKKLPYDQQIILDGLNGFANALITDEHYKQNSNITEVLIVRETAAPSSILIPGKAWYDAHQVFDGVTKSGDTIEVLIPQATKLKNALPYSQQIEIESMNGFATAIGEGIN